MTVVATIEARMTSARLPGKMTLPFGGEPAIGVLIDRLKHVPELDCVVLATTINRSDDVLADIAQSRGANVFRGSEADVLGRVCGALNLYDADVCVEITGDCPFVDPTMVSALIAEFALTRGRNAYLANTTGPELGAPHGLDVQVFEAEALRAIEAAHQDPAAREHVSLPFYRDGINSRWAPRFVSFFSDAISRSVWLSLDYQADYEMLCAVHNALSVSDLYFGAAAMIETCRALPKMTRACLDLRGW
jgi:spore coat polysaccharide biosynthesis protein SpsF